MPTRPSPALWHVVGAIGRTLIGAGIVVLLFAAYQLWGTGLSHDRAQDRLADEFATRLEAAAGDADDPDTSTTTTSTPEPGGTTSTTGTAADPDVAPPAPEPGDPIARLRMPTIGVDEVVVHGVDVADLRQGPGHYPETPLPGQPGNAAIAGHRTTYGQPFHDLDRLAPGDEILVETVQGSFTYRVMGHTDADGTERGHVIVADTAVEVLDDVGDDRLTLTACHPKYSSRQRIVVTAELVETPAPASPGPSSDDDGAGQDGSPERPVAAVDFGEGLDGDASALGPTLLWAGAFLASLAAVVVAGRRWRRWPAYLLGAPVLAVTLVIAFGHLDRYLPAY